MAAARAVKIVEACILVEVLVFEPELKRMVLEC
jgi:hypothetical protein